MGVEKRFFRNYLVRAGAISGPSLSPTRHSDLTVYKDWLCGLRVVVARPAKKGEKVVEKAYNVFGRAVHELFLLGKPGKFELTKEEIKQRKKMITSLNKHPVVKKLMAQCNIREKRRPATIYGVSIKFTPDAHGKKIMLDLKTTSCRNRAVFIESAFEYGYFRQGRTYGKALGINEYWIIGIQKQAPYNVFLVLITEYKEWIDYVDKELEFLLYFYKHYGKPNFKRKAIVRQGKEDTRACRKAA